MATVNVTITPPSCFGEEIQMIRARLKDTDGPVTLPPREAGCVRDYCQIQQISSSTSVNLASVNDNSDRYYFMTSPQLVSLLRIQV